MSDLAELADAVGVATGYTGHGGVTVSVPDGTLRTVLGALGALAADETPAAALERHRRRVDAQVLAPTIVVRPDETTVPVRLTGGLNADALTVSLRTEQGDIRQLPVVDDGTQIRLPVDLPLGYHTLQIDQAHTGEQVARAHLIAVPEAAPAPERGWGWMVQLYALRSAHSWGAGDLGDLRELLRWSAAEGADMVVCNPLHAAAPTLPQEPSPYYPSSRRYWSPAYVRIEDVPEYAGAPDDVRARIDERAEVRRQDNDADRIDRDAVWEAKRAALTLLWQAPRTRPREEAFASFRAREGEPLRRFALWCALAERHGPDWRAWPDGLRHPDTAVAALDGTRDPDGPRHPDGYDDDLADRVGFHSWLQFVTDEQLAAAQVTARHGGMALGVVHDLAVGVNPAGADAWALQDDLATGVTVGAPPDAFNQQGQDWAQPPLLPHRLQETGYAVIRNLVRRLLRHAGGIRIDHILGYFRFFWVPDGAPTRGTYVQYPADDLLGVLALEAHRAGAVIVGEDLGVVAPGVREAMRARRLLGSLLLYFATEGGHRLPPDAYEPLTLASITTHDLPTAAGWWRDEGVRVQSELGILGEGVTAADEYARKEQERASMRSLLAGQGLLPGGAEASTDELVVAMHAFLGRSGSLLVAANLPDAVGDIRQPNMPGTIDQYPNWRLPIATLHDGAPVPISLEDVQRHPQTRRVIDALGATRGRDRPA